MVCLDQADAYKWMAHKKVPGFIDGAVDVLNRKTVGDLTLAEEVVNAHVQPNEGQQFLQAGSSAVAQSRGTAAGGSAVAQSRMPATHVLPFMMNFMASQGDKQRKWQEEQQAVFWQQQAAQEERRAAQEARRAAHQAEDAERRAAHQAEEADKQRKWQAEREATNQEFMLKLVNQLGAPQQLPQPPQAELAPPQQLPQPPQAENPTKKPKVNHGHFKAAWPGVVTLKHDTAAYKWLIDRIGQFVKPSPGKFVWFCTIQEELYTQYSFMRAMGCKKHIAHANIKTAMQTQDAFCKAERIFDSVSGTTHVGYRHYELDIDKLRATCDRS